MLNLELTDSQQLLDVTEIDLVAEFLFMLERKYLVSNKQRTPYDMEGIFVEINLRKTNGFYLVDIVHHDNRQNIC